MRLVRFVSYPFLLLVLVSLSTSVHATEDCLQLFHEMSVRDYPIENDFPDIKIYRIDQIPYNSMAYKHWRSRSAHDLPDSAFNWHYFTKEQRLRAAGFPTLVEVKDPTKDIEKYFSGGKVQYNHYQFYDSYRPRSDKDARILTAPLVGKYRKEDTHLKYIISTKGDVYVFDINAVHEDIVFRAGYSDVLDVGYLDFQEGAIKVSGRNPSFDSNRYMSDYINRLRTLQK